MMIGDQLGGPGSAPVTPEIPGQRGRSISGKYILVIMAVILVIAAVYIVYAMMTAGEGPPPPPPACGNGICETGETYNTCPADCLKKGNQTSDQVVSVSPQAQTASAGSEVMVEVRISRAGDLYGFQFNLGYDPDILEFKETTEGSFLNENGGADTFFIDPSTPSPGLIKNLACTRKGQIGGVDGEGTLAVIKFTALSAGTSDLTLSNVLLSDSDVKATGFNTVNGKVTVQ